MSGFDPPPPLNSHGFTVMKMLISFAAGMSEDSDYTSDINYPLSHQHNSSAHQFRGEPNYPLNRDNSREYNRDLYNGPYDSFEGDDYERRHSYEQMDSFDQGDREIIYDEGDSFDIQEAYDRDYVDQDYDDYVPSDEEYVRRGEYVPRGEEYVRRGEEYVPRGEEYVRRDGEYIPRGEEYVRRGEEYVRRGDEYVRRDGEYVRRDDYDGEETDCDRRIEDYDRECDRTLQDYDGEELGSQSSTRDYDSEREFERSDYERTITSEDRGYDMYDSPYGREFPPDSRKYSSDSRKYSQDSRINSHDSRNSRNLADMQDYSRESDYYPNGSPYHIGRSDTDSEPLSYNSRPNTRPPLSNIPNSYGRGG